MTADEKFWMIQAMQYQGGSFLKSLGQAWLRADQDYTRRLEQAFPELVQKYVEMGRILKESNKG